MSVKRRISFGTHTHLPGRSDALLGLGDAENRVARMTTSSEDNAKSTATRTDR